MLVTIVSTMLIICWCYMFPSTFLAQTDNLLEIIGCCRRCRDDLSRKLSTSQERGFVHCAQGCVESNVCLGVAWCKVHVWVRWKIASAGIGTGEHKSLPWLGQEWMHHHHMYGSLQLRLNCKEMIVRNGWWWIEVLNSGYSNFYCNLMIYDLNDSSRLFYLA